MKFGTKTARKRCASTWTLLFFLSPFAGQSLRRPGMRRATPFSGATRYFALTGQGPLPFLFFFLPAIYRYYKCNYKVAMLLQKIILCKGRKVKRTRCFFSFVLLPPAISSKLPAKRQAYSSQRPADCRNHCRASLVLTSFLRSATIRNRMPKTVTKDKKQRVERKYLDAPGGVRALSVETRPNTSIGGMQPVVHCLVKKKKTCLLCRSGSAT